MAGRLAWNLTNRLRISLSMGNTKTGRMLVSKSSAYTCPDCPFKGAGCYAETSQSGTRKWREISTDGSGISWSEFLAQIGRLRPGSLWRHNEAGDLPGKGNRIDRIRMSELISANADADCLGFTYTHKPVLTGPNSRSNRAAIREANTTGFVVNLSADNPDDAVRKLALGIGPVCLVLPFDAPRTSKLDNGVRIIACPAENTDKTCRDCGWCQRVNRSFVVGFRAHGVRRRMVSEIAGSE